MSETIEKDAAAEVADDAQALADFEAGAAMEAEAKTAPPPKPQAASEPSAAAPQPKPAAKPAPAASAAAPEYVQLTKEQFERLNAAADRIAGYDQQFSKAFGTIGDVQKLVRQLQAQTPRGLKVEIPKDAFAGLAKDFPELAEHVRAGLDATLKGITGTSTEMTRPDPEEVSRIVSERTRAVQLEALDEEYPDWRTIVGAVQEGQAPDPNNPFRKWLATKDAAYQARINGTQSAAVITRAIAAFQKDTANPAPQTSPGRPAAAPRIDPKAQAAQARQARLRQAIQPRGDGAQPPARNSDEDEFEAGFKSG